MSVSSNRPIVIKAPLGLVGPSGSFISTGNSLLSNNIKKSTQEEMMKSSSFSCVETSGCGLSGTVFVMDGSTPKLNLKRKLDHLTLDEKIKRKKLKNRVAAQTSRDRKKLRMDELEAEIKELKENNKKLVLANNHLKTRMEKLSSENVELREKFTNHKAIECCHLQSPDVTCRPGFLGPAVSPQPKGIPGVQRASGLKTGQHTIAIWKILTFCILSQISSQTFKKTSQLTNLKNLQQVCFEKLLLTSQGSFHKQILRLQEHVKNNSVPLKWWGRHQKTWNPVDFSIRK